MGRRSNSGLDYFSFDVHFFSDRKIEFASARFGIAGEIIAIRLLCQIYREGYFIKWGEDEALLFARYAGDEISKNLVDEVVSELLKRGFFSQKHYDDYQILTSNGIQDRYLHSTARRQNVSMTKEYIIADINGFRVDINELNVDISTHSKVKYSKVKESKKKRVLSGKLVKEKRVYGEAEKVLLTDEEYEKLVKKFGVDGAADKIMGLDLWKGSKGKTTNSDYLTILNWERRNAERKKDESTKGRSKIGTADDFSGASGKVDFGKD